VIKQTDAIARVGRIRITVLCLMSDIGKSRNA
jgi:hypothetical protein